MMGIGKEVAELHIAGKCKDVVEDSTLNADMVIV